MFSGNFNWELATLASFFIGTIEAQAIPFEQEILTFEAEAATNPRLKGRGDNKGEIGRGYSRIVVKGASERFRS